MKIVECLAWIFIAIELDSADAVLAHYATSIDILWQQAPRLKEGESGIFLLQPPGQIPRFPPPGLVVVDPLDVLSREQLDRVRRLLKGQR